MHEAELVLFDLDGTLFDHESAARDAVRGWLLGLDVKPTELLVDAWFDAETRHVAAWHRGELDWTEQRRERVREMLSVVGRPLDGTDAVDASFDGYLNSTFKDGAVFPDVEPALVMLERCGVPVAVLSNGQDEQQRQKLAAIGLSERVGQCSVPIRSATANLTSGPSATYAPNLVSLQKRWFTSAITTNWTSSRHAQPACRQSI